MLRTRLINDWTGAAYTMEQVADMDWALWEVMAAEKQGLDPTVVLQEKLQKKP